MDRIKDTSILEKSIGYNFEDKSLLEQALTHSSYCNNKGFCDNERLEFLGDKILGIVIAETLYKQYSELSEGHLSKFLSYLTSTEILLKISKELDLCSFIRKIHCDEASIGANAIEAIIAAIYLDSGQINATVNFVNKYWKQYFIKYIEEDCYTVFNPKSYLQEWTQQNKLPLPIYDYIDRQGTDHQPIFFVKLIIKGYEDIIGKGSSKKHAQKDASVKFINKYKVKNKDDKQNYEMTGKEM